jgi:catechol 2,3-dioxygenase-like lactoylglutathione lyase family enzyme
MKKLIPVLWLISSLAAGAAWAQPYKPNDMGVTMGHWHLNSRDVEVNKKIFVAMGGTAGPAGPLQRVVFPGVLVILNLTPGAPPETGPSVGSVVNHVGFTVPNVQEAVAKWKAAGVPVLPGNNNRLDQAYVETPDGLRIEILENKNQTVPIRNEHVHFFLPDSAIPESQAWYVKTFGAKPGQQPNGAAIADLPGVQLRYAKSSTPTVPTKGRVLDHIGFDISDLQGFVGKLQAAGIKLDRPYSKNDTGVGIAFITDPWGTYIELNERPNAVYLP